MRAEPAGLGIRAGSAGLFLLPGLRRSHRSPQADGTPSPEEHHYPATDRQHQQPIGLAPGLRSVPQQTTAIPKHPRAPHRDQRYPEGGAERSPRQEDQPSREGTEQGVREHLSWATAGRSAPERARSR
ncbi:MAG: hypothetical protein KatS3mg061_1522 [Dehalococcoidia bacterium]|nr:MAG: hypothetical protein KatS3mg061_1522 [Dehalococcoidia bacterium]